MPKDNYVEVLEVIQLNLEGRPPALAVIFKPPNAVYYCDELWEECEEGPPVWFRVEGIGYRSNNVIEALLRPQRTLEIGTKLFIRKPVIYN